MRCRPQWHKVVYYGSSPVRMVPLGRKGEEGSHGDSGGLVPSIRPQAGTRGWGNSEQSAQAGTECARHPVGLGAGVRREGIRAGKRQ